MSSKVQTTTKALLVLLLTLASSSSFAKNCCACYDDFANTHNVSDQRHLYVCANWMTEQKANGCSLVEYGGQESMNSSKFEACTKISLAVSAHNSPSGFDRPFDFVRELLNDHRLSFNNVTMTDLGCSTFGNISRAQRAGKKIVSIVEKLPRDIQVQIDGNQLVYVGMSDKNSSLAKETSSKYILGMSKQGMKEGAGPCHKTTDRCRTDGMIEKALCMENGAFAYQACVTPTGFGIRSGHWGPIQHFKNK